MGRPRLEKLASVGTMQLCDVLNITKKRIAELTKMGILRKNSQNQYDLPDTATDYIKYLQGISGKEVSLAEGIPPLEESKAKKAYLDAQMVEVKLANERMETLPLGEIRERDSAIGVAVRTAIMRIPNDMPGQLEGQDPATMESILMDTCRGILEELSDSQSELWINIQKRQNALEKSEL
jgi:hypothetical protein